MDRDGSSSSLVGAGEGGNILVAVTILFLAFGGIAAASLSLVTAEEQKNNARVRAIQAQFLANGQLAIAQNMVNASRYGADRRNDVLRAALAEPEQMIPGTDVRVEQIGTTPYYVLRTSARHVGTTRPAEAVVRETSPASQYNLYVIDHPVGISGAPRGAIHTNKAIDFYFPGGTYRDAVTAAEGFRFVAGAAPENTTFAGLVNQTAAPKDILEDVDFETLWSEADLLAVTEPHVAEVELQGDRVRVRLYRPAHTVEVERVVSRRVLTGHVDETYVESVPVYDDVAYTVMEWVYVDETYIETVQQPEYAWRDATRTVTEPIYETRTTTYEVQVPVMATRTVQVTVDEPVWVSFTSGGGGAQSSAGTVGAAASAEGYWTTVKVTKSVQESYVSHYRTDQRTRTETVQVGTNTRTETYRQRYVASYTPVDVVRTRQVPSHQVEVTRTRRQRIGWESVTRTRSVPTYETVEETVVETRQIEEEFVTEHEVAADGVIYLRGDVRKLSGPLEGRLSLIVGGAVRITDDLLYVDDAGRARMANGDDREKAYEPDPEYRGDALLAVMAQDDIVYANDGPEQLEVNASLISARGAVGFEGIEVSEDGTDVGLVEGAGEGTPRELLRRLGGIVSRKRPVATYIDDRGFVGAGYRFGDSIMDDNLILSSGSNVAPPFMFEAPAPTWLMHANGRHLGGIE